jgi:hypothetical protein
LNKAEAAGESRFAGMKILYLGDDEAILQKALIRLRLLEAGARVPMPHQCATGVAGLSRVYFLFLPRRDSGIGLVAKFDQPDRAAREWKAINELRRLNLPPEAMLPIFDNRLEDGVVIYKDASFNSAAGRTEEIKKLLNNQLLENPQRCIESLRLALDGLSHFYSGEPGAARLTSENSVLHWRDAYQRLAQELPELLTWVEQSCPGRNWNDKLLDLKAWNCPGSDKLPNPFWHASKKLDELTGRVMLSRVHGDLNLSNILVGLDGAWAPVNAFIIDLSHCEDQKITATDFATLECDFWQEVFVKAAREEGVPVSEVPRLFLEIGEWLNLQVIARLRRQSGPSRNMEGRIAGPAAQLVNYLRSHAAHALKGNVPRYSLYDFFTCLYFTHLFSLRYESVHKHPEKIAVAIFGSSLALKFLLDLETGKLDVAKENRGVEIDIDFLEIAGSKSQVVSGGAKPADSTDSSIESVELASEVQLMLREGHDFVQYVEPSQEMRRRQKWSTRLKLPASWNSLDGTAFYFIPPVKSVDVLKTGGPPNVVPPFYLAGRLLSKAQVRNWLERGKSEPMNLKRALLSAWGPTWKESECATDLSVDDIESYCRWIRSEYEINYSLPTEQEWQIVFGHEGSQHFQQPGSGGIQAGELSEWTRSPATAALKPQHHYGFGAEVAQSMVVCARRGPARESHTVLNRSQRRGYVGVRFILPLTTRNLKRLRDPKPAAEEIMLLPG